MSTVKSYNYTDKTPEQANYKALENLTIDGPNKTIIADLSEDAAIINAISQKQGIIAAAAANNKEVTAYAKDLYIMNTLARYLGALEYNTPGTVKKIVYNDTVYTWDANKGLKASNWADANGTTLVSVVTANQDTSIRTVNLKLVDDKGYTINTTFKAINVPTKEQISAQQN